MSRMLHIEGLTKQFGAFTAVDNISFSVDRGEVLGFLGPNGAGKTTVMRMITGFLPPTAGTVTVDGYDVSRQPIEVKRRIGYLPEGAPLYEDMTPLELLSYIADVRRISGQAKHDAIERAASRINIEPVMHQSIGTLSKGYKRRVGIAQAILHDPEILILDEPTDGLDPNQKHEVRKLINEMAENKAIVISTHLLEELEVICSRAIVIAEGKIVADCSPAELEAQSNYHNAITIRVHETHVDACKGHLDALDIVARVELIGQRDGLAELVAFPVNGQIILDQVNSKLRDGNIGVEEVRLERGRLDEVFRRITTMD